MKRDVVIAALPQAYAKRVSKPVVSPGGALNEMARRLERLEGQMQKLSELVRDHAEDMDRLVRIVAENQEVVRMRCSVNIMRRSASESIFEKSIRRWRWTAERYDRCRRSCLPSHLYPRDNSSRASLTMLLLLPYP